MSLYLTLWLITLGAILFGGEGLSATTSWILDMIIGSLAWPLYWFIWTCRMAWNWKINPK